ncbi:MAG TPA: hypothetical protein VE931_09235, partial [Pyrinomonadaceae bacterium]|nr:hypothetical protein [Pyrinomonadaceae bacterium]
TIGGDTKRRQTKTCGRNTRHILVRCIERRAVHPRTIGDEACLWIGLFPEIVKRALLQIINERLRRNAATKKK